MNAVCEYCYRESVEPVDDGWDLIWQSWLCPACQARAEREHGTGYLPFVLGGEYAEGRPDPRATREQEPKRGDDMHHLDDLQEEMMGYLMRHEQEYGRAADALTVHVNYSDLFEWVNMVIRARLSWGKEDNA